MKLLIIGIDGATFDLILPWVEAGHLPNLGRLIAGGVHGELAVFDFIQPTGSDFSLVNATKIKQPTMWQRLSAAGYRVGVLNVPVTYPPQPLNGFMISGILSPKGGQICYPPNIIERYNAELGEYRVAPNIQYKPGIEQEYIEDIRGLIGAHGDWALRLMSQEPWDVMMVHFIALDIMMHALWRFMDHSHPRYEPTPHENAIRDAYKLVDDYIGRMLDLLLPDTNVMLMSDHGFGPLHKIVNLNIFLFEHGLLKLSGDAKTRAKAAAFRRGITPAGVYRMVERIGLQNLATRVSKETRNQVVGRFLSFENVDWSQTVAYSMGHVGQVYLNMIGREPNGIVKKSEYQQRRQELVETLGELKDENGRPLISKIIVREETYHGPYAENGPDLHLIIDDYNMIAFPLFATDGKVITDQIRGDSGCHRREGIFVASGPGILEAQKLAEANILDLAPTIMHLLGEPVPRIMDGRVLQEIFDEPSDVTYLEEAADTAGLTDSQSLSHDEEAQLEERLRSLGYL
jgi:predicted AlkP superfamily phosphohydrolase/phosphomutase